MATISNNDIQNYLSQQMSSGDANWAQNTYNAAKQYGVSAGELDTAAKGLGVNNWNTADFVKSQGWGALTPDVTSSGMTAAQVRDARDLMGTGASVYGHDNQWYGTTGNASGGSGDAYQWNLNGSNDLGNMIRKSGALTWADNQNLTAQQILDIVNPYGDNSNANATLGGWLQDNPGTAGTWTVGQNGQLVFHPYFQGIYDGTAAGGGVGGTGGGGGTGGSASGSSSFAWNPNNPVSAPLFNSTYLPNLFQSVDPSRLIENRLQSLLSSDSPLLKQAEQRALEAMNDRGLMNSSMATQAAKEAMIAQALNIAGPDAATMSQQALANQSAQNQFGLNDRNQQFKLTNDYQSYLYNNALSNNETASKFSLLDKQNAYDLAKLDKQIAADLQKLDKTSALDNDKFDQQQMSTYRQAYIESMNRADTWLANTISSIQNNAYMTADQKASQIAEAQAAHNNLTDSQNQVFSRIPGWANEWLRPLSEYGA